MLIWFDTEFIDDGRTIELISIGMVREDDRTLYLENAECDLSRASEWVKKNVVPGLIGGDYRALRHEIAEQVREFAGERPDFWAYYAAYDWVVLCQLFGTMLQVPYGWPKSCMDVRQEADRLGHPHLTPLTLDSHNAMTDAFWTRAMWKFLKTSDCRRTK